MNTGAPTLDCTVHVNQDHNADLCRSSNILLPWGAAQMAAAAAPDGYTLFVPTITTFVVLPEMHDKLPFDLERDFTPIGLLAQTPMMFAVAPSLGVGSMADLVTLARIRP